MAFNQSWDETSPTDSDYGYQIDDFIRNLKEAIRERKLHPLTQTMVTRLMIL